MGYYKKLFDTKLRIAGSSKGGAKPAFMLPPDSTFSKVGYQIYEVLDLICEGPVAGLTDQKGLFLEGTRATKDFDSEVNKVGSIEKGVDRGVYYNDNQLRTEGGAATYGKYDINFIPGEEFQDGPKIIRSPRRLIKINQLIKGPYDMSLDGPENGARSGKGSRDVRIEFEGSSNHQGENLSFLANPFDSRSYFGISDYDGVENTSLLDESFTTISAVNLGNAPAIIGALYNFNLQTNLAGGDTEGRDFVNWQNFVPAEQNAKPYYHYNYDRNITKYDISLVIESLNDARSSATKGEVESGSSKVGSLTPLTITFEIAVGKVDKLGNETISAASFTTRSGKGVTLGQGNGRIAVSGVVTSPYHISLEGIPLPLLDDDDLYNFIRVRKIEFETYSSIVKREGGVANIIEIIEENLLYPNSTMVESSIDAKYFPEVPNRTFRLKGKKVLIPSNYFPIEDDGKDRRFCNVGEVAAGSGTYNNIIYSGDWNGTFKFGWTDNPAWIFYDLLVNTRYGVGAYLQDVNIIDKWSLYEMGMYCDAVSLNDGGGLASGISGVGRFMGLDDGFGGLEPRFSMNVYMSDQVSAYDTLQDFAKGFMASTYYNDSVINVRMDKPHFFQNFNRNDAFESKYSNDTDSIITDYINPPKEQKFPPHLIFNNNNVINGMFAYSDVDKNTKHNSVEVSYLDRRNNYTTKTEYAEDSESIKKVGLNYKSVDGLGVTSRGQAVRLARTIIFEANNTTEKVSFNAGLDALLIEPGDIIQIDDELKNFTKNFGTVIGTSGQNVYFDPDGTGAQGNIKTGIGPKAIIVQPALGSDQLTYITGGNLNIVNPLGQSGISQFYNETGADNELYRDIHQPQVISLQLVPGGSGLSYRVVDDKVHLNIENLKFFGNTFVESSQWFSEKSANILHGAAYSVDASGRSPKYYRVLSVAEDLDNGFSVSAMIHHTGKYKFIEENIAFDTNEDAFEPELQLSDIQRPVVPQSVTTGTFTKLPDNSLTLPLTITHASSNPGDRFTVISEEPNTNVVVGSFGISNSSTTSVVLKDNQRLDQIGTYTINVFSESSSTNVRSTTAATISFTTNTNDFGFDATSDALVEYNDISLRTEFANGYSGIDKTGSGINSYIQDDENINAVFDLEFKTFFGGVGNSILDEVSGQIINLYDVGGTLVKDNFKNLDNEKELTITNDELTLAFKYTGDGRFIVPPSVDFEIGKFTASGSGTASTVLSGQVVTFEEPFGAADSNDDTPAVFISQVITESGHNIRTIGRRSVNPVSFSISGASTDNAEINYIASKTGVFLLDNAKKKILVGRTSHGAASNTGYHSVVFPSSFDTAPNVVIQAQNGGPGADQNSSSLLQSTVVKDVTANGFKFISFQEEGAETGPTYGNHLGGNSKLTGLDFAYIAIENGNFNVHGSDNLPTGCINFASKLVSDFNFRNDTILNEINKNNDSNFIFNHNQFAVFPQRMDNDEVIKNKDITILRTGGTNTAFLHYMNKNNTGSGMRFSNSDALANYIYVTGNTSHDLNTDFTLETWARFETNLTGKQYLFDHTRSGTNGMTGIGWFQSGDGKNYLQLNGTDYQATDTNLNDGVIRNIRVYADRNVGIKTFIDGSLDKTNTSITPLDGANLYADTGYKILSPMQSSQANSGVALHQGGVFNYFGFFKTEITPDYTLAPNNLATAMSGASETIFLLKTGLAAAGKPVIDINGNEDLRQNVVATEGTLLNDELINQDGFTTPIAFIAIATTGTL